MGLSREGSKVEDRWMGCGSSWWHEEVDRWMGCGSSWWHE